MQIQHVLLGVGAAALTLVGCSSFNVSSDYDPAVDCSQYGAYAWLPQPKRDRGLASPCPRHLRRSGWLPGIPPLSAPGQHR